MELLLIIILTPVCIMFSFHIATWAGGFKKIGFWWTFFFCLTLTPLMGFIIASLSSRAGRAEIITGFKLMRIMVALGLLPHVAIPLLEKGMNSDSGQGLICLMVATGLWGLFLYNLQRIINGRHRW